MSGNTNFQADPELGLGCESGNFPFSFSNNCTDGPSSRVGGYRGFGGISPGTTRGTSRIWYVPCTSGAIDSSTDGTEGRVDGPLGNDVDDAPNIPPEEPHEEYKDFDDGANPLWSLYEKEVRPRDEAQIQTLKDDMDGVLIFAGLFSAVLTAFVVPKIQDLQVTPAQQSVFYQQQSALYQLQSAHLLSLISQQLALLGAPVPVDSLPPLPSYTLPSYTFHPSASNRRVNVYWLLSLIFSLLAALLATLIQQWVRAYMRVFQRSSNPLKTARIRLFLFEGVDSLPVVADAVPGLIHISLLLFFLGLIDTVLNIHKNIAFITLVPITLCGLLYFCSAMVPIWNPRLPYRNPFSSVIWRLVRNL
ncbi:hypothetical protein BC826DRAFT_918655, partial [Russula brevipes]